jgi:hypothetical protein
MKNLETFISPLLIANATLKKEDVSSVGPASMLA